MLRGVAVLCLLIFAPLKLALALPPGFAEDSVGEDWNEVAALSFDASGRAYVWERAGRVWIVEDGLKRVAPLIDISDEIVSARDFGLFGFALHPSFAQNGYLYLYYAVDRQHRKESFDATIGRIVRYTARASDDFNSVDPASRLVLAGAMPDDSGPSLSKSHDTGSLVFGRDGKLLASLSGELWRIDPDTGAVESADADPGAISLGDFGLGAWGSPGGATGGVWYVGSSFPATYRKSFFLASSATGLIRSFHFDASDQPARIALFHDGAAGVVHLAVNPTDGTLYYVTQDSEIRRVRWVGLGNEPPKSVASADVSWGGTPLEVELAGSDSSDPEGLPLSYLWSFGDGATSTEVNPVHVFTAAPGVPTRFTVALAVSDATGLKDETTLSIWVENSPPQVEITSRDPLLARVHDAEHGTDELTCAWQTARHLNGQLHTDLIDDSCASNARISPVGCDGEASSYTVSLTVTDPLGLGASDRVTLPPGCSGDSSELAEDGAAVTPSDPGGMVPASTGGAAIPIGTRGVAIETPVPQAATFAGPQAVVVGNEAGLPANAAPLSSIDTNAAPQVAITSPADLSAFVAGDVWTLGASASDPEDGAPPGFHWEIQRISNDALIPAVFVWDGRFPPAFTVPAPALATDHVSYLVKLTVTDQLGKTASDLAHIVPAAPPANQPPVAGFTRSPGSGAAPLSVSLDASASADPDGDYLLYDWNLGDGASASGRTVAHTYSSVSAFNPVLVVTDAVGATSQTSADVTVTPPALLGEYFDEVDFTDLALTRSDETIDFDWSAGSPAPGIGEDTFSVRWTGRILPEYTETFTFYTASDSGVRLWIDDALVIDDWTDHTLRERSGMIALTGGVMYAIRIDYYENGGDAVARLSWSSASQPKQIVPAGRLLSPGPTHTPPSAVDDAITVAHAGSVQIPVLANDLCPDGALDPASLTVVTPPLLGTAYVDPVSGVVTYVHAGTSADTWDSFAYTVEDANGAPSLPATVWLALVPAPRISLASPVSGQTLIGTAVSLAYGLSGYQPLTGGVRFRIDGDEWITLLTPGGTGAGHKFFNNVIHDNSVMSGDGAFVVEVGNCNDVGANGVDIHDNYVYTPNDSTPSVGWVSCSGAARNSTSYQIDPGLADPGNSGIPGAARLSITADDVLLYQRGSQTGAPATDYLEAPRPTPPSIGALDAGAAD